MPNLEREPIKKEQEARIERRRELSDEAKGILERELGLYSKWFKKIVKKCEEVYREVSEKGGVGATDICKRAIGEIRDRRDIPNFPNCEKEQAISLISLILKGEEERGQEILNEWRENCWVADNFSRIMNNIDEFSLTVPQLILHVANECNKNLKERLREGKKFDVLSAKQIESLEKRIRDLRMTRLELIGCIKGTFWEEIHRKVAKNEKKDPFNTFDDICISAAGGHTESFTTTFEWEEFRKRWRKNRQNAIKQIEEFLKKEKKV